MSDFVARGKKEKHEHRPQIRAMLTDNGALVPNTEQQLQFVTAAVRDRACHGHLVVSSVTNCDSYSRLCPDQAQTKVRAYSWGHTEHDRARGQFGLGLRAAESGGLGFTGYTYIVDGDIDVYY